MSHFLLQLERVFIRGMYVCVSEGVFSFPPGECFSKLRCFQHITQILEKKHFTFTKDCYCSFHNLSEIPGNLKEGVGL